MVAGLGQPDRWAIILAGGDGFRLRPLTRRIVGDERPKQFCPFLDGRTLLEQTHARVARLVRPDRICLVLTRSHEPFYAPLLARLAPGPIVAQPQGRGTGPAILFGVLRVAAEGPRDAVALFPSDHYVADDEGFMAHVDAAFAAVESRPDLVVLLGIEAEGPEVQYGWIEAGEPALYRSAYPVYRIRRFWEKPGGELAERLLDHGCLWNSFVLVARVPALLALFRATVPVLSHAFTATWSGRPGPDEDETMRDLYARIPSTDFSKSVLATNPPNVAVLPVRGVGWSDWGEPGRVLRTLDRLDVHPAWAGEELISTGAGLRGIG